MTLTIGSLCTGYGGLDQAVTAVLDAELAWVADPDPGATRILAHHHPTTPNLGDITGLAWSTVPQVDILTAGYPCQPFSQAGLRKGTEDERHIWPHIADALCVLRPRLVVLENVRGHLRRGFDTVLADLARFGFDAEWACVRASDVGAPHRRERMFIVAWPKGERPYFPRRPAIGGAGGAVPGELTLLPTPRVSDSTGPGMHGQGGMDLRTAISLLPTPRARDSKGRGYEDQLPNIIENLALLPTPTATPYGNNQSASAGAAVRPSLDSLASSGALGLLPTPWASDGTHGGPNQRGSRGDLALPAAVQPNHFGEYAAAVAQWEPIVGRQAPAPTEPTGKDGGPQLSPRFVEWLMGLPEGHVTSPEIGLKRGQQLHALGNGVVPQQGAYALRLLLERATADVAA